jgi:hypothetical protein
MPDEETDTKDVDDDSEGSSDSENRADSEERPRKGKKRKQELTEDEKKAERRAANRRSAFQSRQRRKVLIEDLQKTVSDLSKENSSLRSENEALRLQLDASVRENRAYRLQQQLSAGNPGAGGYPGAAALMAQTGLTQAQLLGAQGLMVPNSAAGADQLLSTRLALAAAGGLSDMNHRVQGLSHAGGLGDLNDPLQRVNLGLRGNLGGLDQGMQGGVNHLLRRAEDRSRARDKAQDSD